jgi:hypothetical protein
MLLRTGKGGHFEETANIEMFEIVRLTGSDTPLWMMEGQTKPL